MLPDWVFRIGWGTPIVRKYLQLRMEADQLDVSIPQAKGARKAMESSADQSEKKLDPQSLRWAIKTPVQLLLPVMAGATFILRKK